ncbi:hypothetical protein BD560DRAFT_424174 [Blakeslea trispora]|nr:hypothetical protein BD560DRAFT_424174 [Blakeslea trispora]
MVVPSIYYVHFILLSIRTKLVVILLIPACCIKYYMVVIKSVSTVPLVVYSWSSWCEFCVSEIGAIVQVVSPFGKKIRRFIYSKISQEDEDESTDVNCSLVNQKLSLDKNLFSEFRGSSIPNSYPSWD